MAETYEETLRRRAEEQRSLTGEGARDIARKQESALRQGYSRGTEPMAPTRQVGPAPTPLAPARTPAGGLATGVISSAEQERRRRAKAAAGVPLTQEDLQ